MTRDSQHSPYLPGHPEDLFEAYALGALEDDELEDFEAHLGSCTSCCREVAGLVETTGLLAQSAPLLSPPAGLRSRVMGAVEDLPPVFVPARSAVAQPDASSRFTLGSFAMPLAAALVIGLLSASLIMNVITTNRLNSLEAERQAANARLAELETAQTSSGARLNQIGQATENTGAALKQVMETSYLMARPYTQPLLLRPTDGSSDSEGILLVNNDGREAILMLSNMDRSRPSQGYQVWLARDGHQYPIGEISVDSSGWGTIALNPPESLYGFDWINLTVDQPESGSGLSGEMVLQTRIISPGDR